MNRSLALVALAALLAAPAVARGQTCSGNTPFTSGIMRAGGAVAIADGSTALGGEFAGGEPLGLFGTAYFAQTSYSGHSGRAAVNGGTLGYSVDLGKSAQICPVISILHADYPSVITAGAPVVQPSMNGIGIGAVFGMTTAATPTIDFMPFVGADFINSTTSARVSGAGSADQGENYGRLSAGFAIVYDKTYTIRPRAAFAVGRAGGNNVLRPATEYGIGLSVTFWGLD